MEIFITLLEKYLYPLFPLFSLFPKINIYSCLFSPSMMDLWHYKGNNKHLEVILNIMTNSQLRTMFAMCSDLNV